MEIPPRALERLEGQVLPHLVQPRCRALQTPELVQTGVTGHTASAEKENAEASIPSRIGLRPVGAVGVLEAAVSGDQGRGRQPIGQIATLDAGGPRPPIPSRITGLLLAGNLTKGVEVAGGSEAVVTGNQGHGNTTLNAREGRTGRGR